MRKIKMVRLFDSYDALQKAHQEDISNFPILWLFGKKSDAELAEAISKIGAKSVDELVGIGGGGYIHKEKKEDFLTMMRKHAREKEAFSSNPNNLIEVIFSEMCDHEYNYTQDPEDTLNALGKTYKDLQDPNFKKAWKLAEKKCLKG